MSFTKFVGTFLQATFFGGTYDDVAFEVRVLKGEVARLQERMDREVARLEERLDALDGGKGGGVRGKSRLRIMSSAEAADVSADEKLEAAPEMEPSSGKATKDVSSAGGLQVVAPQPCFRPEMSIAAAWNAHPQAPTVFAQHHLPGCIDCPLSEDETLEDGAKLHSLDPAALLADLEKLVTA